jgi:DNA-binding response OmpR family regulator
VERRGNRNPGDNGAGASRARILVVEDDRDVAAMTAEILDSFGYEVRLSHRAVEALERLAESDVDLVFSDVVLPGGMSGVQLAAEVQRRFSGVPVLLTSGYSAGVDQAAISGAPVITKPYRLADLQARIERLLRPRTG